MAMAGLKVRCVKCGYSIPLTSEEQRSSTSVSCPKCATISQILREDDETIIEED
ncbi:MAG: hypothetical protein JW772_02930 [Candidatus Diapherotrites archaeon]|nr:hypothetical protein [Candidatus Diapherotrites archaeon]